jgi:hypothetical protein
VLQIRGKSFRLGDLADIDVSVHGDIPELDEEDE